MAGAIFDDINPNATSGTQLANLLNAFKDAYASKTLGAARPSNLQAGGTWVSNAADPIYNFYLYDGAEDILLLQINTTTNTVILPASDSILQIVKESDDAVGPVLNFIKKRLTTPQTLTDDVIMELVAKGVDAGDVEYSSFRIQAVATDDVTSSEYGCDVVASIVQTNSNTLSEVLRLTNDRKVGIGGITPLKTIHAYSEDSSAGIRASRVQDIVAGPEISLDKERATGNGQVLNADNCGAYVWYSTDQNGAKIEVAKIEVLANENHTDTEQGVDLSIYTKQQDTNTYQEAIKIEKGKVSILGQPQDTITDSIAMLDDSATRELLQIDSSEYKSFVLEINCQAEDATTSRTNSIVVRGKYDTKASTWRYNVQDAVNDGSDSDLQAMDLAFVNAAILTINYVETYGNVAFVDGEIDYTLRRVRA